MKEPKITHQVFYAKNFYAHTDNIISDMRKVCELDMPGFDFSSPYQILKFMRKQYKLWLENNPEIPRDKDGDNKVAWESDPIKAEIWHILIKYSCYIPMTNIRGFIKGLPRYDVLKPQYNVGIYHFIDKIFNRNMTTEQLLEKTKEILNMSNTEIMDIMADILMKEFPFKKASKLLSEFHEDVLPAELDDELWDLYSNLIGYNLLEDNTIREKYLHSFSKHFSIEANPKFACNSTTDIQVNLVPKRWEYTIETELNKENFETEYLKACDKVLELAKVDFPEIALLSENIFTDDRTIWEAPKHMHSEVEMENIVREILHDYIKQTWIKFDYDDFITMDEYDCHGLQTGCFGACIRNDHGKMKVALELHTIWHNGCFEHSLHNYGSCFISESRY